MLIIIPSYRRTEILPWVMKSVFRCDVSNIEERKKVVVVNNFPPNREIVNTIVDQFNNHDNFTCIAIHRQVTIPAIDSWFSAINEHAIENEVVFLLGDDDLMLPWGLTDRYSEIIDQKADFLLSDYAERIYFFDEGKKYWMPAPLPMEIEQEKSSCQWNFWPSCNLEASFMSNHCYRNTIGFRRGLKLAFEWCDSQSWLKREVRTAMLPFYLPYAITIAEGKVVSLNSKCVIRGAVADEAIKHSYADGGNTAFYNLCAFDIFENRSLPLYDERLAFVSAYFKPTIIGEFMTMVFDSKIPIETLIMTLRHSGIRFLDLISVDVFKGLRKVCISLIGLRGVRLRFLRQSKSLLYTEQIFRSIEW